MLFFKIRTVFTDMFLHFKQFQRNLKFWFLFSKLLLKMTAESRSSNSVDVGLSYSKAHCMHTFVDVIQSPT